MITGLPLQNKLRTYTNENEILAKWRNHCYLLMAINHFIVANFCVANMSFNTIRENKILAKISEFTV